MAAKIFHLLPGGENMPAIGLGTWEAKDDEEIERAVNAALELGYRHIDTAYLYDNEQAIGRVLKQWLSSGKVKREDLFITTKLPPTGVHPDRVELFMKKSLENLQLNYVDLYLIHVPAGCIYREDNPGPFVVENGKALFEPKTDHAAVWKKMEEQVNAGRAKNIGLSNYNISQISTVLKSAKIKPSNLQVELHILLQQRKLRDFCKKNGITVVAYCPLANPSYQQIMEKMGEKRDYFPNLLGDPTIAKLAQKYSKSPAQIALRFLLQIGVTAIPKSVTPKRLEENINVFDFAIDDKDMQTLYGMEVGEKARLANMKVILGFENHPDYPFKKCNC